MNKRMSLKGVIFDMDGTIFDVAYDWKKIKEELGTGGKPILHFIRELQEPERSRKWKVLERHENKATQNAVLKKGIRELLDFLSSNGIKRALVTNNTKKNVEFLLDKFDLLFDCLLTRENGMWKPSGKPFLHVLKIWRMNPYECCVVGDSPFDADAAEEAGIKKVFLLEGAHSLKDSVHVGKVISVEELHERISAIIS